MAKPYSNSAKSRGYGSSNNLGSSISQGANIETLRYQNEAALPTQSENDAQLFADIGKGFSAPGDRPRGGWRNLGAGIAKGLEYGAKSNAIGERKENYDKYANVMNYLQEANNAVIEQNQWYEKRESARKEMMPQVLAYIDNIDKLNPQSQRIMAQDMLAQYGEAIGEDFKLSSVDGSNPFLVTVQSSKGQQMFDMRSLFAGDEVMQQNIAMQMPKYQMKLEKEEKEKLKKFQQEQEKIDLMKYEKGVPGGQFGTKQEAQGQLVDNNSVNINGKDYMAIPLTDAKAATAYRKEVTKASNQIPINNQAIETIEKMEEIFNRKPEIGNSFLNALDAGDENSWSNLIAKKFTSSEDLADVQKLKKLSSDLNLSTVLGVQGKAATDLLKQTIKAAAPHGKLTPQAFGSIAQQWKKTAEERNDLILAQMTGLTQGIQIFAKPIAKNQNPNNITQTQDDPWNNLGKPAQ